MIVHLITYQLANSSSDICRILSALVTLSTCLTHFNAFHIVISGSLMRHIPGDALVTPHLAGSLRNGQFSQCLCVLQQSCKVLMHLQFLLYSFFPPAFTVCTNVLYHLKILSQVYADICSVRVFYNL